jgi:AraC-like DNA-binding protein
VATGKARNILCAECPTLTSFEGGDFTSSPALGAMTLAIIAPMQEISDGVGYQDVGFFRALLQPHTGVSPSAYRRRFGV